MLRLNRCSCPMSRSMDSRKSTVHMPPMVSKLISTTMLSTKHFSSFTCMGKGSTSVLRQHGLYGGCRGLKLIIRKANEPTWLAQVPAVL